MRLKSYRLWHDASLYRRTWYNVKCLGLCGIILAVCVLASLALTISTPVSPALAVYEESKETTRESVANPSPSDARNGKKISKHKTDETDRAAGLVRPLNHAQKPKIAFFGRDFDGVVHQEKILVKGFVEGPRAMRVHVDGAKTKASGSVFFAEVNLKKGKNTLAVTATAPGSSRARETFEVTYWPLPKPEFEPEVSAFQAQSGNFAAQESPSGVTFSVDSTEDATDANPGDGSCATVVGHCTLRAAVQETNAAPGKDIVELPTGNYVLTREGRNEDVSATGDLDITDPAGLSMRGAGRDLTVIDAGGRDRAIQAFSVTDLEMSGLTITGGDSEDFIAQGRYGSYTHSGDGGGIWALDTNLTLMDVKVHHNVATGEGGGVSVASAHTSSSDASNGNLSISRSQIIENTARDGGGVSYDGFLTVASFELRDSTVSDNSTTDGIGGGIYNTGSNGLGSSFTVTRSTISGNMTAGRGGGGGIWNDGASLTVEDSTVSNNVSSYGYGGGISNWGVFDADTFRVVRSTVSGNRCVGPCEGGGGGISYFDSNDSDVFEIHDSVIENNVVDGEDGGGGIIAYGSSFEPIDRFEMTDTTISGNSVTGGWGGGLSLWWEENATIEDSIISGNESHWGAGNDPPERGWGGSGGGALFSGTTRVINTTISGNFASADPTTTGEPGGGGIYNEGRLHLGNVTLSDNRALLGSNISNVSGERDLELSGTVVTNGRDSDNCSSPDSLIASGGHNLDSGDSCGFDQSTDLTNTDPLLEPLADNGGPTKTHKLKANSPAIDAGGNYCPPTDQRGEARMHDGNGDGIALADIGAFEVEGSSQTKPCIFGKFEVEASAPESLMVDNGALTPNPFTVSATVRYEGYAPVENAAASLSSSPRGLTVEGEKTISLGLMNPDDQKQVSWQVRASGFGSERTYKLFVKAAASGLKPKVASTQITVPAVPDAPPPEESACRTPYPDARPTENTPLILVPGIGGTELFNAEGKELWPGLQDMYDSDTDEHLLGLRLNEDGTGPLENGPAHNITIGDAVRAASFVPGGALPDFMEPGIPFGKDVYGATVEYLKQNADYEEGVDLFVFPFDWRKDVVEAGNEEDGRLIDKIDCVLESTGAERVDIMAHSQGGLVTMAALSSPESEGKVRKVLTLGTPVLGATKALGVLEYQMPCFSEILPGVCISNHETTQEVMRNFPGAYQLLPSPAFDEAEGPPLIIGDEEWGYDKWSKLVDRNRNAGLRELAFDSHQGIFDDFTPHDPSVEFKRAVGTGLSTADRIREYETLECTYLDPSYECETVIEREVLYAEPYRSTIGDGVIIERPMDSGDGTVPRGSAEAGLGEDESNVYFDGVPHLDLAVNEDVLEYAVSYFGVQQENGTGAMSAMSSSTSSDPSDEPSPFDGIELQTIGPVEGYVRDQTGNVLGSYPGQPEGMILTTIPGGIYDAISGTQSFFLNERGSYKAELAVRNKEQIKLRVRTYAESRMNGQAVFEANAPAGADLRLGFATGQDLKDLRLLLDDDGDGTVDRKLSPNSVAAGAAASEIDPPETKATLKPVGKNKVKVTLSATDGAKGSGIAATHYFVEGSPKQRTYEKPFVVPRGTTVRFYSVDRAGNEELSKEIKISKKTLPPAPKPKPKPAACTIKGTNGNDILRGTAKDDVICGLGGNDVIGADKGNDTVRGGAGNDVIRGGGGDDRLNGGGGNDKLDGQSGKDTMSGGGGNDALDGRDNVRGNDSLDGGPGKDSCRSDPGDKTRNCSP